MPPLRAIVPTLAAVLLATAVSYAQSPPPTGGNGTSAGTGAAAESAPAASEVEYVRGPEGQLRPVIPGKDWEEYLEWKRRQAQPGPAEKFQIQSLALEGTADDERAVLTAKITVRLLADGEWVEVPLRLNEAILGDAPHFSVADDQFLPADRDNGHRCLMRGKGEHELTLDLVIPLARRLPGRRLQLQLPQRPQSVSSALDLRVPVPAARLSAAVQPANMTKPPVVRTAAAEKGTSRVTAHGLGERLDLTWQELPDVERPSTPLQVETAMRFNLTSELVLIGTVAQRIQPLPQGSLSEIRVRLPAGFELLHLHVGQQEAKSPETDADPLLPPLGALLGSPLAPTGIAARAGAAVDVPLWVVVRLPTPATDPVDLEWDVRAPFPRAGALHVDGFQVDGALREAGTVRIEADEGYQLTKEAGEDVYQIGAAAPADGGRAAKEFAFRRQPFRLALSLQEVEPYYTVEPHYFLRFAADRVDLLADLHYSVHRGALQQLDIDWPAVGADEWTTAPLEQTDLVEQVRTDDEAGTLHVRLLERQGKGERFRLLLRAERRGAGGAPLDLTLPAPAGRRQQAVVVAAEADDVAAELAPLPGTVLRPVPARLAADVTRWLASAELPDDEWRDLRRHVHSIETNSPAAPPSLRADLTTHEPKLACKSEVTARLRDGRIDVTQYLHYEVSYALQSQIRVSVPEGLVGPIRFAELTPAGEELPLDPTGGVTPAAGRRLVWFTLSEGRRGKFDVVARFSAAVPAGPDAGAVTVPLVQSTDATSGDVRFALEGDASFDVTLDDETWSREAGSDRAERWVTDKSVPSVTLTLSRAERHEAARYTVERALIRTECLADGYAQSRAAYRVVGAPATLTLTFPPDALVPDGFWWDRQELLPAESNAETGEYRLEIPADPAGGEHLLTVDYHAAGLAPFAWSQGHEIPAPAWPEDVWVARAAWELILPPDQHLFTPPEDFTPRFSWRRAAIFWHREPAREYADLDQWIGASQGPPPRFEFPDGNSYVFSRFGPARSIAFRSMNRSVAVLLGAGLALAAGFVLLRIPATRHVMTLLAAAFAVAVVALWYPAPVQFLLQPALLGLLLAAAASWTDGTFSRRRVPPAAPLSAPSDYLPPSHPAVVERGYPAGIGSEDPTALRPPLSPEPRSSPSTVSGHSR